MAGKQVNFEVNVDAADAIADFKKVGKEAEKAGKAIEKGLEVSPDTGKVDKFITNLKAAADEAEKVGKAVDSVKKFAPEVDDSDIAAVVLSLRKAGTEFDEIELKAKELGTALKQVDVPQVKNLGTNLRGARTDMDSLRSSSDQSRSVLANMAGNTAQDLGALGGAAGSAGVLIGQLAEYATEGNINLGNLAKLAGPMAGLAAVSLGVAEAMKGMAESKAFDKAQVDAYADALGEINDEFTAAVSALDSMESFSIDLDPKPFEIFADQTADITNLLSRYGITVNQLAGFLTGTAAQQSQFRHEITNSITDTGDYAAVVEFLNQQLEYFGQAQEFANRTSGIFASTRESVIRALSNERTTACETADAWDRLFAAQESGNLLTEESIADWQFLRDQLQLGEADFAALFDQRYQDHLTEQRDALREAAEAQAEYNKSLRDAGVEIDNILDELPDLAGGLSVSLDTADATIDFQGVKAGVDDAIDNLQTYVDEQSIDWTALLDTSQIAAGDIDAEMIGLVQGVRDSMQEGIVAAFEIGGAGAAQHFLDTFVPQLMKQGGLTQAQVFQLLGLPEDGSVQAVLDLVVEQAHLDKAKAILNTLAGVDPDNPIIAAIQVGLETEQIDPDLAYIASLLLAQKMGIAVSLEEIPPGDVAAAQALIDANPVTFPTAADTTGAEGDARGFRNDTEATTATVPVDADTAAAATDLLDLVSEDRTATIFTKAVIDFAKIMLDNLAADRTADVRVRLPNYWTAEGDLNHLARDRDSTVHVHMVENPTGEPLSPNPEAAFAQLAAGATQAPMALGVGAAPLTAPTSSATALAPAPIRVEVINQTPQPVPSVHLHAAVIGNPHEVDRVVSRALRRHRRLNGTRN